MPFSSEQRLEILSESAHLLSSTLNLNTTLRRIVALVSKVMNVKVIAIMLREEHEEKLVLKASHGLPHEAQKNVLISGQKISRFITKTGKPLLVENLRKDTRFTPTPMDNQYVGNSFLSLPLKSGDTVIGVISVSRKNDVTPLNHHDQKWLSVIAKQASMALEKVFLHRQVSFERDRIALLNKLSVSIITDLEPTRLMKNILRSACRLLSAERTSLLIYNSENDELRFATAVGTNTAPLRDLSVKPGQGLAGWVFEKRQPVLVGEASRDKRFWPQADSKTGTKTSSLIAVPLLSRNRSIGVLEVINRKDGKSFNEDDLRFTEMLASMVSTALENSFLYDRVSHLNRHLESLVRKRTAQTVKANRELKSSLREVDAVKRFNESIINNLSSGLIAFDSRGRIISINPPACDILGLSRSLCCLSLENAFGKTLAGNLLDNLRSSTDRKIRVETSLTLDNSEKKIIGYTVSRMKRTSKGLAQWILIFRDLTEVKKRESDMARLDRMVTLGEISAQVCHDLKNPLAAMSLNMQYMSRTASDKEQKMIRAVLDNIDKMGTIVSEIGLISRELPLEEQEINLTEIVSKTISFLDKIFKKNRIFVSTRLSRTPLWIKWDPARFQQILLNLLMNAVQAMKDGGRIKVRLSRPRKGDQNIATLVIEDNGPGIHPSLSGKIFQPYFTTKETGTGLGLSSVFKAITKHGGTVTAENIPSGGASFRIVLPLAGDSASE